MKKNILLLFFSLLMLNSYSSHIISGHFNYQCIGQNEYIISLTLVEDCNTAFLGTTPISISIIDICGGPQLNYNLPNVVFQQYSGPCDTSMSTCGGGLISGFYIHRWQDTITLASACDEWIVSHTACCRNSSVNTAGQDSYYYETIINNQNSICNSNVARLNTDVPAACAGMPTTYNPHFLDPDNDSLVFSLVPAFSTNNSTSIVYAGGYSGSAPIPGITIDQYNGVITFTTGALGEYVVAILAEEYSNGVKVGETIFDFKVYSFNCGSNVYSPYSIGGITNFSGSATNSGDTISGCANDNFCFDLVFADSNSTDTISVIHQLLSTLPGASITMSGYNPLTLNICGNIPPNGLYATLHIKDNSCPFNLSTVYTIVFNGQGGISAGQDEILCGNPGILNATGGTNYQWSVLSGDPITPSNFSCDSCATVSVNPSVTTTYLLQGQSTTCNQSDTVTVYITPSLIDSLVISDTVLCANAQADLEVFVSQPGTFSYSWSSSGTIISNQSTATFSSSAEGSYNIQIEVTSQNGCTENTSASVIVYSDIPNGGMIISASQDTAICNVPFDLSVFYSSGGSGACGPNSLACNNPAVIMVGNSTGSNTNMTWPAMFGNWYANARHQFLFTASELNAAGIEPGLISGIDVEILQLNNSMSIYPDYTIKMGCTNISTLTSGTWETGLSQVFNPKDVTISLGNNSLVFDTPYGWDGTSNIIIEICYNWDVQYQYTSNASNEYTTTSFVSSLIYFSDGIQACSGPSPFIASNNRPVISFHNCETFIPATSATIDWSPATYLNDSTAVVTSATISAPTTFYVSVTDTFCLSGNNSPTIETIFDSIYIPVTINSFSSVQVNDSVLCPGDSLIANAGISNGMVSWTINNATPSSSSNFQETFHLPQPGSYILNFSVDDGCTIMNDSLEITVLNVFDTLELYSLQSDTVCFGDSLTYYILSDVTTSNPVWSLNGIVNAQNSDTITLALNTYGSNTIEVSNGNQCAMLSDSVSVLVFERNINISNNLICEQDLITADAGFILPGSFINWTLIGGSPSGSSNTLETFTIIQPGNYILEYSGNDGCENFSDSIPITVYQLIDSLQIISLQSDTVCLGDDLYFYTVSDDSSMDPDWSIDGINIMAVDTFSLSFLTSGSHTVVASKMNGCSFVSDSVVFYVSDCLGIYYPFTEEYVSCYQNLSDKKAILKFHLLEDMLVEMKLFSVSGQELYFSENMIRSGDTEIQIPIHELSKGIYLLNIHSGKFNKSFKILR